jgi:hypothetical protein
VSLPLGVIFAATRHSPLATSSDGARFFSWRLEVFRARGTSRLSLAPWPPGPRPWPPYSRKLHARVSLPMKRHSKRKKAKYLAVASAVLAALTWLSKEVISESLRESHDAVTAAESRLLSDAGRSVIELQNLTTQQLLEINELKDGNKDPNHDYTQLILRNTAQVRQIQADVRGSLDNASDLIDVLPSRYKGIREERTKTQALVDKNDKALDHTLAPTANHDWTRLAEVKLVLVQTVLAEISVVVLGDQATDAAKSVTRVYDLLIKLSRFLTYAFGLCAVLLGFFAAVTGAEVKSAE